MGRFVVKRSRPDHESRVGSGDTEKAAATPTILADDATNYKRESRIATTECAARPGSSLRHAFQAS